MKRNLPAIAAPQLARSISFDLSPAALSRWNASMQAKESGEKDEDEASINIYDMIGMDFWTGEGITAKRIAGILRNIGDRDVVVNINSPGGDLFEGIAIYNLLRDHKQKVTCRVIGLAASAASLILMAGDEIQVARAGFVMVHNVWVMAIGNRNDLRDAADQLETFDDAMASVYAARTGLDKKECAKLMDKESWFSGEQAIEQGFADALLPADEVEEKEEGQNPEASVRSLDARLARRGMPRTERRQLINEFKELFGKPGAADPQDRPTQDAGTKATLDAGEAAEKRFTDSLRKSANLP